MKTSETIPKIVIKSKGKQRKKNFINKCLAVKKEEEKKIKSIVTIRNINKINGK
jgi:hypothetical protein